MKLIIQIPCFNEAAQLPQTLDEIPRSVPGFDEVARKAIDYARKAGDLAGQSLAYEEAARLYGMSLAVLGRTGRPDDDLRTELLLARGDVQSKAGDLAAILTNLEEGDVLFIDEIHRLNPAIEEILYPAMEYYSLDIMIGQGTAARSIKLELPKFTLVGATTRPGLITAPLRGRFGIIFHLDFYGIEELQRIVERSAGILNIEIDPTGSNEIARRSRGTPRI